jgi:hypothetical protein
MKSSSRKLLLAAVLIGLLRSNAPAGDPPPKPENCIEVEIEHDTGKGTPPPLLDDATAEKFRKWRYKPKKVHRVKMPVMLANEKK